MNERYEYGTFLRPHWLAGTRRGPYQMRAIVPNSGQLPVLYLRPVGEFRILD